MTQILTISHATGKWRKFTGDRPVPAYICRLSDTTYNEPSSAATPIQHSSGIKFIKDSLRNVINVMITNKRVNQLQEQTVSG